MLQNQTKFSLQFSFTDIFAYGSTALHQDGRVVKALDLRSNGRIVRVGSNAFIDGIPLYLDSAKLV